MTPIFVTNSSSNQLTNNKKGYKTHQKKSWLRMKSLSSKLEDEEGRASETLTVEGASDSGKFWKQAAEEEERWS